jgi:hypothetical protein
LAAIYLKVNLTDFLSQWSRKEHVRKNLKIDDKRAAVELWRAKVPISTVRNQLKMFERTLRRVLAFKRANTLNQIKFRKPMSGRLRKISMPTRVQEVIIQEVGMTRYQQCLWSLFISTNIIDLFIKFVFDGPRL